MVEHLTITVKIAYNRIKVLEFIVSEKQKFHKRALLDTTMDFPKGVASPGMNLEAQTNMEPRSNF